ncbi:MAG: 2-phosphosulfolactate phosphatase family protein [Ignavibacteriaceae bacterium]
MKINVLFSPVVADELYFTGKTVVVIDVLRASGVIITALENGAKEIIPVATVEFAVKVSGGMFGGQTLLGGERNTKKIDGFALGNSPLEYTREVVAGKTIVLYTTNGSKAIVKAKFAENLFISNFSNLKTIAGHLAALGNDVEILCAGRSNLFSLEDTVCSGRLVSEILKLIKDCQLSDSSKAALHLSKSFGTSIQKMLKETEHGKILIDNGFESDIDYCAKLNTSEAIPFYSQNSIRLLPLSESQMQKEKKENEKEEKITNKKRK